MLSLSLSLSLSADLNLESPSPPGEYYAGGSGIVMNRAALRKLGRAAEADYVGTWGNKKFGPEDLLTGMSVQSGSSHPDPSRLQHSSVR